MMVNINYHWDRPELPASLGYVISLNFTSILTRESSYATKHGAYSRSSSDKIRRAIVNWYTYLVMISVEINVIRNKETFHYSFRSIRWDDVCDDSFGSPEIPALIEAIKIINLNWFRWLHVMYQLRYCIHNPYSKSYAGWIGSISLTQNVVIQQEISLFVKIVRYLLSNMDVLYNMLDCPVWR